VGRRNIRRLVGSTVKPYGDFRNEGGHQQKNGREPCAEGGGARDSLFGGDGTALKRKKNFHIFWEKVGFVSVVKGGAWREVKTTNGKKKKKGPPTVLAVVPGRDKRPGTPCAHMGTGREPNRWGGPKKILFSTRGENFGTPRLNSEKAGLPKLN